MRSSQPAAISAIFIFLASLEIMAWAPPTKPSCRTSQVYDPASTIRRSHLPVQKQQRRACSTRVSMITDLFRGNAASGSVPSLPRDVKEAVSSCRSAVQNALQKQISRMVVEFPAGTKFGVERVPKNAKSQLLQDVERSDRELARLFVEMFQPVGGENIAVVFADDDLASLARSKWEDDASAECRVLSVSRKKPRNSAKAKRSKGFAAKLSAEVEDDGIASGPFRLPEKTEVAMFVAPGPKEVLSIERVCNEVGMGTLVILLNPRLTSSGGTDNHIRDDFETVFMLAPAPLQELPGCVLYRSYPNVWALGRKPKLGPPKTILSSQKRPTTEECRSAFEEAKISSVEKGLETTVESIASWFR